MVLSVTVVVWLGDIVSPVFSGAKVEPRLSDRCCWDGVVVALRRRCIGGGCGSVGASACSAVATISSI